MGVRWRDLPYLLVVVGLGSLIGGLYGWLTYSELDEPLS